MDQFRIIVSLTTNDNDYQIEQAKDAENAARRLGVDVKIIYAENDAITQSQQLLKYIQGSNKPDAIVFEPVGTGLPQVARAAAQAGIGWAVLNKDVDYLTDLRRINKAPMFALSSDHYEVGRIEGRQIAALVPNGGYILYLQGPASSSAAMQRSAGMTETKPANVQVRAMKGQWTEESAYKAVVSWLRLSTSREVPISAVVAQNDSMAIGARRAFKEQMTADRDHWLELPFLGCDGMPETGQAWVKSGVLKATIQIPPNAGQAVDVMVNTLQTHLTPPEQTLTVPTSFPPLEKLAGRRMAMAEF